MTSSRTEPGCPGICSTSRACARQPNGAPCDACARLVELFLADAPDVRRMAVRGCRGMACGIVVSLVQAQMLRHTLRRLRPLDHDRLDGLLQQLAVVDVGSSHHDAQRPASRPRRSRYVSCPVCRDPWGSGRQDPPKTRLAHGAVGTLPAPVHAAEFLAVFDQHGPQTLEHSLFDPALHRSMNRRVVAELPWQLVPLARRCASER